MVPNVFVPSPMEETCPATATTRLVPLGTTRRATEIADGFNVP